MDWGLVAAKDFCRSLDITTSLEQRIRRLVASEAHLHQLSNPGVVQFTTERRVVAATVVAAAVR